MRRRTARATGHSSCCPPTSAARSWPPASSGASVSRAAPYPLILPVNYVLDGDAVVIRTDSPKITAAADHTRVAFEVDDVDERTRSGWSVLVQALAEEVTGSRREELVERLRTAGGTPWAPGEHGHWIRLIPKVVTGRRIIPGQLPPPFEAGGYL